MTEMFTMTGTGDVTEIAGILQNELPECGISCELVSCVERSRKDFKAVMLVFEKYFYRTGNRDSISVLASGDDGRVTVDALGSGGGASAFFNYDLGISKKRSSCFCMSFFKLFRCAQG